MILIEWSCGGCRRTWKGGNLERKRSPFRLNRFSAEPSVEEVDVGEERTSLDLPSLSTTVRLTYTKFSLSSLFRNIYWNSSSSQKSFLHFFERKFNFELIKYQMCHFSIVPGEVLAFTLNLHNPRASKSFHSHDDDRNAAHFNPCITCIA